MKEKALLFGKTRSLVGVLTEPEQADSVASLPGVIILNSGLLPKIGPNRLHVKIARRLAAAGFTAMRFDFSGIGDSLPRKDGLAFVRSAIVETQEAMDLLAQTRGLQQFILMGICSGADNAVRVAHEDARVAGAALIDSYAFPTPQYFWYSYRKRLLNVRSWVNLLAGKSDLLAKVRKSRASQMRDRPVEQSERLTPDWHMPSQAELAATLHDLLQRGTDLLFVYSGGSPAYFNYLTNLKKLLSRLQDSPHLRLEFLLDSDHGFTLLHHQKMLVDTISNWVKAVTQRRQLHENVRSTV
ncbi:MAG: hypothetical protein ONB48_18135 [candidate division KSB1 bacterium]|nr:hypothetical protein [candidate division KSB1 bacterium]MDZ7275813.1 hypothetical protein [candidate division KSB1 bacterium]MDZ7287564.1 hypothetical protein [candidate division KSB1 bacterium]MDZ7308032.1 hypothetical protein [candidate division KSB1 bacterium]MDZ7350542.1 hypothetical protein [candidate division KSB1 bacterium]